MKPSNIVIIVSDSLRYDKILIKYQNKDLTPFLSKILNNSIYFKNCIVPSPWTLPSHASFFTGLYPSQHKCVSILDKLDKKIPTFAEILKNRGYYTVCYSENPLINDQNRLTKGFDVYIPAWKKLVDNDKSIRNTTHNFSFKSFLKKIYDLIILKFLRSFNSIQFQKCIKIIDFTLKKQIRFFLSYYLWEKKKNRKNKNNTLIDLKELKSILDKNEQNRPLLIFFNIMATHDPYFAPKEILNYFGINRNDFWVVKDWLYYTSNSLLKYNFKREKFTMKKAKSIVKFYNSCVYYADRIIKKIFEILDEAELLDNAFVIITSDHGEQLGEHNLVGHTTRISVFEEHIKVPLIIYNQNFSSQVIKNQVELINLFHTVIHLSNIDFNEKIFNYNKSLFYQAKTGSFPEFIYGEYLEESKSLKEFIRRYNYLIKPNLILKVISNIKFLKNSRFKLIKYSKFFEFYDLAADPSENYNIGDVINTEYFKFKNKIKEIEENIRKIKTITEYKTIKEKELIKKSLKKLKI
ncbi:MAG: sulfatase-like hydrolase/transferase [Candidatus Helarchaeota archaeon]